MNVEFKKLVPDTKFDNMFKAVVEIDGATFESNAVRRQNEWNIDFESWHETHFEVVSRITIEENSLLAGDNLVQRISYSEGTGGLYLLAKRLTDEFETLHKGKEWGIDTDNEYFDAIEEFLDEKLK